jgi:Holliday junction resolvase RusA-like endonuclease
VTYSPREAHAEQIAALAPFRPRDPWTGPLRLALCYLTVRTAVADVDNLAKATMDCMTRLGFWADDCQVYELSVSKVQESEKARRGVSVVVWALGGPT